MLASLTAPPSMLPHIQVLSIRKHLCRVPILRQTACGSRSACHGVLGCPRACVYAPGQLANGTYLLCCVWHARAMCCLSCSLVCGWLCRTSPVHVWSHCEPSPVYWHERAAKHRVAPRNSSVFRPVLLHKSQHVRVIVSCICCCPKRRIARIVWCFDHPCLAVSWCHQIACRR